MKNIKDNLIQFIKKNNGPIKTIALLLFIGAMGIVVISTMIANNEKNIMAKINDQNAPGTVQIEENTTEWKGETYTTSSTNEPPIINSIIYMPGFEAYYEADDNTYINFGNEEENDETIYLQYIVMDEEEKEIYKSGLIEQGQSITWKPADYLVTGENAINLIINAYKKDGETMVFKTYLTQNITIKII